MYNNPSAAIKRFIAQAPETIECVSVSDSDSMDRLNAEKGECHHEFIATKIRE